MKRVQKASTKSVLSTFLILAGLAVSGCCKKQDVESPIRFRPGAQVPTQEAQTLPNLLPYYREAKFPVFIKKMEEYLKTHDQNHEARLFLGLAYSRYGDYKRGSEQLNLIPLQAREMMTDSCLELRELIDSNQKDLALKIATDFFPDCKEELAANLTSSASPRVFSNEDVMRLGKEYDDAISNEDDEEIRRRKEEDFQKKHKLDYSELEELTARYLELLSGE